MLFRDKLFHLKQPRRKTSSKIEQSKKYLPVCECANFDQSHIMDCATSHVCVCLSIQRQPHEQIDQSEQWSEMHIQNHVILTLGFDTRSIITLP